MAQKKEPPFGNSYKEYFDTVWEKLVDMYTFFDALNESELKQALRIYQNEIRREMAQRIIMPTTPDISIEDEIALLDKQFLLLENTAKELERLRDVEEVIGYSGVLTSIDKFKEVMKFIINQRKK